MEDVHLLSLTVAPGDTVDEPRAPASRRRTSSGQQRVYGTTTKPQNTLQLQDEDQRKSLLVQTLFLSVFVCTIAALATILVCIHVMTLLWKTEIQVGFHILRLVVLLLVSCLPCCIGCSQRQHHQHALVSIFMMCGPLFGLIMVMTLGTLIVTNDYTPILNTNSDESRRVAVLGSGASGLTAAWLLAKSGREVTIFEAESDFGGHSKTWQEPRTSGNGMLNVDLGFIFNKGTGYPHYKRIASHFQHTLVNSSLNISSTWEGKYWDNTGRLAHKDPALEKEIEKFEEMVRAPSSMIRTLTPLGLWLRWQGFSDEFFNLCLKPALTVLFVTKMGIMKQSTQATLDYFKQNGFIHLRYGGSKVQINLQGSQNMWQKLIDDMKSTGRVTVHFSSRATSIHHNGQDWEISTDHDQKKISGFSDVIMATPAKEASALVQDRSWATYLANEIEYVGSFLTLHTDKLEAFKDFNGQDGQNVLYFVHQDHLTGKIGQIFGDPQSELLISVHQSPTLFDKSRVKKQFHWFHHYFSVWEIIVARLLMPNFQGQNGLHYAGDWVMGVGHNDAIISGISAACAAGLKKDISHGDSGANLYHDLIRCVCKVEGTMPGDCGQR